jgi:hypothetical protein
VNAPILSLSHQTISFIKSGVRIFGYYLLMYDLPTAALVLIFSEFIGVAEEIGQ